MLILKIFLVVTLFFANLASKEKNRSRYSRSLRFNDDDRPRATKHQIDPEYLERCRFVNIRKNQRLEGHMSVLAFLDPTWQYSFRQAIMLKFLSIQLQKSGFPDIRFFVIAPPADLTQDKLENELEIQAWREIPMYEDNRLPESDELSEMILIQDDPRSRIWQRFHASKNQVLIVDRCGKLTYRVMVPWSILYFPYTKAAILSTYREDPCGACDPPMYKALNYKDKSLSVINTINELTDKNDNVIDDRVWAIERNALKNSNVHSDESLEGKEEEDETSTASSVYVDETDTSFIRVPSSTTKSPESAELESAYRHDFPFNDNNPNTHIEEMHCQKELIDSTNRPAALDITRASLEIGRRREGSAWISTNNFEGTSHENARDDRILLEPTDEEIMSEPTIVTEPISDNLNEHSLKSVLEASLPLPLPLRIIMQAPHVHRNGRKTRKHTHLILKTGNPHYHGHLDSGTEIFALSTNSWRDVNLPTMMPEKSGLEGTELINEKGANQKFTYDRDESPGLYGEIVDYWRSLEDSDITDKNETSDDNYRNSTINEEYRSNISGYASESSEENEYRSTAKNTSASAKDSIANPQDAVGSDATSSSGTIQVDNRRFNHKEDIRTKLVEHYSKLLPWIYYILNS